MPYPCDYDDRDSFVSACISERQHENPDEDTDQSVAACISIWDNRDCGKAMTDRVIKAHHEKPTRTKDGRWTFVVSSDAVDRSGDIVRQNWVNFSDIGKRGLPALFGHDTTHVVGRWFDPRVETRGRRQVTLMDLELLPAATNDLVSTTEALVERGWLACSVGFRPLAHELMDKDDPWGAWDMIENELLETSVVAIGMNQEALPEMRTFMKSLDGNLRKRVEGALEGCVPAAKQYQKPAEEAESPRQTPMARPDVQSRKPKQGEKAMPLTLSDKIQAREEALADLRNRLTTITEGIGDDGTFEEDAQLEMDELTVQIERATGELESLNRVATAMQARAAAAPAATKTSAHQTFERSATNPAPRIESRKPRKKGHVAMASLSAMLRSYVTQTPALELINNELPEDKEEVGLVVRAATNPADMGTATWAGNLVRDSWGEFLELIRDMSIYPNLPGPNVEFGRFGRIPVPRQDGRGQLAGSFVGEGAPIPVRAGSIGMVDLTPKKLGIISDFTKEIGMHSIPAIQGIISDQILGDTAEALDTYYLDAQARTTIRPAGLQDATETGAGNINASTGNSVAQVLTDTKAMIGRLMAARTGNGAVWIMNPLRVQGLMDLQDAASGAFVFRAELQGGTFRGYPVLSSENVAADVVTLQANSAVMYGNDYAPMVEVDSRATLVYDDTAPEDIVSGGLATTMPVKSLFQTDGIAVKMTHGLDWRIVRVGGVQVLTGVSW